MLNSPRSPSPSSAPTMASSPNALEVIEPATGRTTPTAGTPPSDTVVENEITDNAHYAKERQQHSEEREDEQRADFFRPSSRELDERAHRQNASLERRTSSTPSGGPKDYNSPYTDLWQERPPAPSRSNSSPGERYPREQYHRHASSGQYHHAYDTGPPMRFEQGPPPQRTYDPVEAYSYPPPPRPPSHPSSVYDQEGAYHPPRSSSYSSYDGYPSHMGQGDQRRPSPPVIHHSPIISLSRMLNPAQEAPRVAAWEEPRPAAKRSRARTTSSIPSNFSPQDGYDEPMQGEISYTSDAATKLNDRLRRQCFNCLSRDTSTWRRSNIAPGKMLCNKCGLFERTHHRARPEQIASKRQDGGAGPPVKKGRGPALHREPKPKPPPPPPQHQHQPHSGPSLPTLPSISDAYGDDPLLGLHNERRGFQQPPFDYNHIPQFDSYDIPPMREPSRHSRDERQYAPMPSSYQSRHTSESPNTPYYSPAIPGRSPYVPSQQLQQSSHGREQQHDRSPPAQQYDVRGHMSMADLPPLPPFRFDPLANGLEDARLGQSTESGAGLVEESLLLPGLKRRRASSPLRRPS